MKRFIGYISMCTSLLAAVLVGVVPTILSSNGNSDYSTSRNFIFKISERKINNDFSSGTENPAPSLNPDSTPLEDIVETFKTRLDNAEISEYKLETIGDDTLSLTFKDTLNDYDDVINYLTFSNSIMLKNYDETYNIGRDATEVMSGDTTKSPVFEENSARVEYLNGYPYVVVTLSDPDTFKNTVDELTGTTSTSTDSTTSNASYDKFSFDQKVQKADDTSSTTGDSTTSTDTTTNTDSTTSDGSGDAEEVTKLDKSKVLFVVNNWLSGLDLSDMLSNNDNNIDDSNLSEYVVTFFDLSAPSSFYWNYDSTLSEEDQKAKVYDEVYFQYYNLGAINDGDKPIDVETSYKIYNTLETDDRLAYKKANLLAHELNSSNLQYEVTLINENQVTDGTNIVAPFIEFINRAGEINYQSTVLIATAIAIVICALFILLNYGLSGLMGIITIFGNIVASLGVFNVLGNEFNIGTILGLLLVALISTFGTCLWLSKAKGEIYAGKVLKKAYQEANKKTNMNIIGFSVIGAIIGLTCYLIPNSVLTSFGAVTLLGSAFIIVINFVAFRGVNWLLYNSTFAQRHPKLFAIDTKVKADLSKDVKSTYLESFKKKTPKSTFKIVGIISSILFVASVVGLITFQSINGNIYNSTSNELSTRAVITYNIRNSNDKYDIEGNAIKIQNAFSQIYIDSDLKTKAFKGTPDIDYFYYDYIYSEGSSSKVTNSEVYFVVDLGKIINDANAEIYYLDGYTTNALTASEAFSVAIQEKENLGTNYLVSVDETYDVRDDSINLYVLIAAAITFGVTTVYFLLRYGPSKALSGVLIVGTTLVSVVGIFSLIRGPFTSEITLGILFLSVLGYIMLDVYYSAEKLFYKENRHKLEELETREVEYNYLDNLHYNYILIATALSAFSVICFYFSTAFSQYTLGLILVGIILLCIFVKSMQLPLEIVFTKEFAKLKTKFTSKKKFDKKNRKVVQVEEGPEEAIFSGIND